MKPFVLSHKSDLTLRRDLATSVTRVGNETATALAHLAEFDARKLYAPEGYPSMHAYCVGVLHLTEDIALKWIQAARVARAFPALFEALADGRLHLSAVRLLAPHLRPENADELLALAAHRTKAEIVRGLAERFPRPESLALVEPLPARGLPETAEHAPGHVPPPGEPAAERPAPSQIAPIAARRYPLKLNLSQEFYDKLSYALDLLGRGPAEAAALLEEALDGHLPRIERRKFGASARPGHRNKRSSANPRYIPMHVRHAVWKRDGAQCTFVSESGHRCEARSHLEFDHIVEVARGGESTVGNLRLRCRTHNQYAAECTFGAEFMRHKREEVRETRARAAETKRQEAERRKAAAAEARREQEEARRKEAETRARAAAEEVITPLRLLGFSAKEAQWAANECTSINGAPLEQRVRLALNCLRPRTVAMPASP